MKTKLILLCIALSTVTFAHAQVGLRGGVNMANEIRTFNKEELQGAFSSDNLTGYQAGLVLQLNPRKSELGLEMGALMSQKTSMFCFDSTGVVNNIKKAYQEINYIEVPLNLRYRLCLGALGIYGSAGVYGDYALNGKSVFDSQIVTDLETAKNLDDFMDRLDYGYSLGCGIEIMSTIQIGANWSQGLVKKDANKSFTDMIKTSGGVPLPNLKVSSVSKVFSVSLTYLF